MVSAWILRFISSRSEASEALSEACTALSESSAMAWQ
jgi:hypothetical protein